MSEDERIVRHHLRPAPSEAEEALDRLLSAARAEGYAQAREQAQEIVGERLRGFDAVKSPNPQWRSGVLDMHAAAAAALNAMQEGAVDEGRISIDAPDAIDDVVAFVDTGAPKP